MSFADPIVSRRATALRSWTRSQLTGVQDLVHAEFIAWSEHWSLPEAKPARLVTHGQSIGDNPSTSELKEVIGRLLFGADMYEPSVHDGPVLALRIVDQAWADWIARVTGKLQISELPDIDPKSYIHREWSGDAVLELDWFGVPWRWVLDGQVISTIVGPRPEKQRQTPEPKVPVLRTLHDHSISTEVGLSPVTLQLGELTSLAVGDTIRLPHPLSMPLHVRTVDAHVPLCQAWLCQRNGQLTVELVAGPK